MTTGEPMACGRCGEPHERCSGHNRAGNPCGLWPLEGQRVCKMHGGMAPQNLAAAAERVQQQQAEAEIKKLWPGLVDARPVTNPVASMQRLAGQLEELTDQLGTKVNGLGTIEAGTDLAQLRGLYLAHEKAVRQLASLLESMQRLGIAEQQLQLEQDKARMVATAVLEGLAVIAATAEQREAFMGAFLGRVRAIEGGLEVAS